jgi:hypothetical protein
VLRTVRETAQPRPQAAPRVSWAIERGHAGDVDLGGLAAVLAFRYDDDQAGSPWDFLLYLLDDHADARQRAALHALFTGALGGPPLLQCPWAFNASASWVCGACRSRWNTTSRGAWFRAGEYVMVRARDPVDDQDPVSSVIPGITTPVSSTMVTCCGSPTGRCDSRSADAAPTGARSTTCRASARSRRTRGYASDCSNSDRIRRGRGDPP